MKVPRLQFCRILLVITPLALLYACDQFLEVDVPGNRISNSVAFSDDNTADAVVAGIYTDLYTSPGFASGSVNSVTSISGLSSDELTNIPRTDRSLLDFEENEITTANANALSLWASMYKTIYEANAALSGLVNSPNLTKQVSERLRGESLFIRGFTYFYLVNFFGEVPLLTSTDYKVNSSFNRNATSEIYTQIISDLSSAEQLLPASYHNGQRIRPNKSAASALLARIYLFTGDWARAEDKSTLVISNNSYELSENISNVFLSSSKEAIWQLRPPDDAFYTNEGFTFNIAQAQKLNAINSTVIGAFESNDKRLTNWIASYTLSSGAKMYLPQKYKRADLSALTNEFYVVMRLAEVYLIRAEARIKQGKVQPAISDLDIIRDRAGLPLIGSSNPTISQAELFVLLQKEKRLEFLVEWGHRWLDIKRWDVASDILAPVKSKWSGEDELYPIPQSEINKNNSLKPQNPGY